MFHLHEVKAEKYRLKSEARAMIDAAISSGKDLAGAELKKYNELTKKLDDLQARIDRHEAGLPQLDSADFIPGFNNLGAGNSPAPVDMERFNKELGAFLRGTIMAADVPLYIGTGAGVESVGESVPTQVMDAVSAYFNLDSFGLAGARILNTQDTIPLTLPIISAGAAAGSYAEGASATESQPFAMDAFTFGGTKYSRLVKVSEEALMNSAIPLQSAIMDELAAGIATTFTAAITTALLAKLGANAGVLKAQGVNDIYHTLLEVMHAVPPRYASAGNKWMLSRATLSLIKDQRADTSGVPFFDAATNRIFEKDVVLNDNLSGGQVVYGSWFDGAIIRKSPYFMLPLRELYSAEGKVGVKATQYLDQHFLCEVTTLDVQPLYYTVLS